ncbi:Glycosyl transferase family 2 [Pyrobaculum oguniense TE7]|uniref:Glycosyl transferase family 2 n=1 Tax=Pyrobaculum oguniense (strain DSM 13380 / JCM 10595 / TE7) TaxID=698757 RepID=H6QB86_PYROT|nr:Glycosyl transferase family 2 [Pyrobaculum oguniense TE7]
MEVVASDGALTDGTSEIAARLATRHLGHEVAVLREEMKYEKDKSLNDALQLTAGEVVIADADLFRTVRRLLNNVDVVVSQVNKKCT